MADRVHFPNDAFTSDQCAQLGASVANVMADMVRANEGLPEGFAVENGSLEFYLGDSAGELVGGWKITIERTYDD